MRILAVTTLFPNPFQPYRGAFNRLQFRSLAREHKVQILAPLAWTSELAGRWVGRGSLPPDRRLTMDGVTVDYPRYLYPPGILRQSYGRFYRWSIRRPFLRAVEEFRPDLVFATWAYPDGWATVDLAHRSGLPVVLKVHGSDVLLLHRHPGRHAGTVAALRRADRVVAVSRDLAAHVAELGVDAAKIHVVYNGVDPSIFSPGPKLEARRRLGLAEDLPVLLFVGNLLPVKGVDILIDACSRLAARGIRYCCHLIGQGPLLSRLERQTQDRGLAGQVRLHGPLPQTRIADWYRAADVLVLPSRSEGVPNVLLEAASSGLPFVASHVGGIPEIAHLGDSHLVPAGDAVRLAEALEPFLVTPARPPAPVAPALRDPAEAARELTALFQQTFDEHRRSSKVLTAAVC